MPFLAITLIISAVLAVSAGGLPPARCLPTTIYECAMKLYKLLLLLPLNLLCLAGCGQPGPLYLPGQAAPIHVEPESAPKPETKPEKNQ